MVSPAAASAGLRKRSIGFWESLAVSVEAMGPLLGAIAVAPLIAATAGLLGAVHGAGLRHRDVHRGADDHALRARAARAPPRSTPTSATASVSKTGFLSTWLSFMYYVLFVPQLLLAFGLFANSGMDFVFGVNIAWWVCVDRPRARSRSGCRSSASASPRASTSASRLVADAVLLITSVAIVAKVASAGHLTLSSLLARRTRPAASPACRWRWPPACSSTSASSSPSRSARRSRDPHGNVPKAIFIALIGIGAAAAVRHLRDGRGVRPHRQNALNTATTADGTPWWAALSRVGLGVGWRDALSLVIIISILGNTIASHNAVVRIQYGMGRAGAMPEGLRDDRRAPDAVVRDHACR